MTNVSNKFLLTSLSTALLLASSNVHSEEDTSGYDNVWSVANLYENKESSGLQKLALSGRLHIDAAHFEADEANGSNKTDEFEDANFRRLRFGFKGQIADNWSFNVEADLDINDQAPDTYKRLTDAYVAWTYGESLKIKALKQSAGFTMDGATSSKKLYTLQRNNLTNNLWFTKEYFTGVSASGKLNSNWSYKAGVFSSNNDDEIAIEDANTFVLTHLTYKFGETSFADKLSVSLDYVYKDKDGGSDTSKDNAPNHENVVSLSSKMKIGKFGLDSEYAFGEGYDGQSDLWGIVIMPHFDFTSKFQGVLRYTYMESDDSEGIKLGRYENKIGGEKGDEYQEFYTGLNYYFYGQKLKVQAGVQYTEMDDSVNEASRYEGWGITTGLKMYW